jgi:solute carrier family 38 (sodium-coupled neutral amino acid transporter), member 9
VGGTDSSFKVVTNVANTMIGSAMIIFPVLFIKDGLFSSLIAMSLVCVLQYSTCRLLVEHNRPDEPNFNRQIARILGPKWSLFNSLVNVTLLFVVCIGYYLLIVENLFMVSAALITLEGYNAKWASVIATLICIPMLFMKDIELLLKFFKYTIYCVMAFGLFILVTVVK